jgi:hypothetical protein
VNRHHRIFYQYINKKNFLSKSVENLCESREGPESCAIRGQILASSAIALLIAAVAVNGIIELPVKQKAFAAVPN